MARLLAGVMAIVSMLSACTGESPETTNQATPDSDSTSTTTSTTTTNVKVKEPSVTRPDEGSLPAPTLSALAAGKGSPVLVPPTIDMGSVGYLETEWQLSGTAQRFRSSAPLSSDGTWGVAAGDPEPFATRVIVRRPADESAFNGTVVVEWFNVTGGLDAAPDWSYLHRQITRSGAAWVGVSAQKVGIDGGGNPLGAALALKIVDPERYASLVHPGDDYSYDMLTQTASAIWFQSDELLAGLAPERVIATGESQSSFRMATYVNALAPSTKAFSGYLIHSRGAGASPLINDDETQTPPDPTLIRPDVGAPVLSFFTETDVDDAALGAVRARQPDTDAHRTWEVAGTAHADAYMVGIGDRDDGSGAADRALFDAMAQPPSSIYFGVISCDTPINTGPHTYVLRAALTALDEWIRSGSAPPERPRLDVDAATKTFRTDELGNALGGIRTPQVDTPIAVLSGLGQSGSRFCGLFGTTAPLTAEQLQTRYGTAVSFRKEFSASLDDAIRRGDILEADAVQLRSVIDVVTPAGLS